jgi:UV DNA damage endonuclease
LFAGTWQARDGPPIADYSSQAAGRRAGAHTERIDPAHFRSYLRGTRGYDFDIMCEIKDKERSALIALRLARPQPALV